MFRRGFVTVFCASCKVIFEDPRYGRKQFLKKRLLSQWKTTLAIFFSHYRVWQTSSNILLGSTRYYGNHCAVYKILSVTPKRWLKKQTFDKKDYFSSGKILPAIFSRSIEYEKPQGTKYKGPKSIASVFVQVIGSFLQDLGGRWKKFLKKSPFSRGKTKSANFTLYAYYRIWQTSGNKFAGSIWFHGNHCASFKIISVTPKRMLKKNFWEERLFFERKIFSVDCFSY